MVKVSVYNLDVSPRLVDCQVSMGEGGINSTTTITLMDFDNKVQNHLTARTQELKGIVGVPRPKPQPVVIGSIGGGGAIGGTVDSGSVGTPSGFSIGSNGIPSYPTPANERDRILGIIKECLRQGISDSAQIAYVLATVKHECGNIGGKGYYRPVSEIGGAGLRYAPYYGRGLVQLTWSTNYKKYERITGKPIHSNPNLVITDFGLSCFIMIHGFKTGGFTGKKITDYIGGGRRDFIGARRCINGTDKASLIAGYANQWLRQLPAYMGTAKASPPVASTSTPRQAANKPQQPATTTAKPPTPAPTSATPQTSNDVPDGDTIEVIYEGQSYEFIYTGFSTRLDGLIVITGAGARKAADNADVAANSQKSQTASATANSKPVNKTVPDKIPVMHNASVKTTAQAVASRAGAKLVFQGGDGTNKPEIVKGNLKPSQLLAKEASEAGKTVTDTGKTILVRDKVSVNIHTLPAVLEMGQADKPVQDLALVTGSETTVKGFPTLLAIPLNQKIIAGDKIVYSGLSPKNVEWVADKVTHRFLDGVTELEIYSPFEANPALINKPASLSIDVSAISAGISGGGSSGSTVGGSSGVTGTPKPGSVSAKIYQTAISNRGKTSRHMSGGGRVACADAVNAYALKPVFGRKFGENPSLVISVEADLKKSGWKLLAAKDAYPGCVAIAVKRGHYAGHIGIVVRQQADPFVLSNSSSRAAWVSEYAWEVYMGRVYAPARFAYYAPPGG